MGSKVNGAILIPLLLFGFHVSISSQDIGRPQVIQIWDGQEEARISFDIARTVRVLSIPSRLEMPLHAPPLSAGLSYWNGRATAVVGSGPGENSKDEEKGFFVAVSEDLKTWKQGPASPAPFGYPYDLHETGVPDLFLGVNTLPGFKKDDKASYFAWWKRRQNGIFELDSIISLDDDGPIFDPNVDLEKNGDLIFYAPKAVTMAGRLRSDHRGLAPISDNPIRVPGAFVLASLRAGVLWILKDGDSSPRRTLHLVNLKKTHREGKQPFLQSILCLQPTPEGKVLIAAREEAAVLAAHDFFDLRREGKGANYKEEMQRALLTFGGIEWWELDPDEGTLDRVNPPGALNRVMALLQAPAFSFLVRKGGSVVCSPDPNQPKKESPKPVQGFEVPAKNPTNAPLPSPSDSNLRGTAPSGEPRESLVSKEPE